MIEQLLRAENALALGLLDQAEQIYARTLVSDPANAIAAVGLARVALERGDDRASLGLARRALAIDPENAQAGRMVDRLVEVMRERGEEIPPDESPVRADEPAARADRPAGRPAGPGGRADGHAGRASVPATSPDEPVTTSTRRSFLRRLTGRP
jgi:tetratricopeptide (TPR) repeat protein